MSILFTPGKIGALNTPNRLVRSATAESMADADGRPRPQLVDLYRDLAKGGIGLIITGHMFVHPSGIAHPEMTGIHEDELVPDLSKLAEAVHQGGGKIMVQINHGGMFCETVSETIAPSAIDADFLSRPAREMRLDEIDNLIDAYSQAAKRVRAAGFDGVQIHAAHGYLISQFLSPYVNRRNDRWGGDPEKRRRFLREICQTVRQRVGNDFPVLIKLGMMDGLEGGLTPEGGAQIVASLEGMGIDGVEISGGLSGGRSINVRKGIRSESDEAYFLPLAKLAREVTKLPILLVGGFRSRNVMARVLEEGHADFISLCRPLVLEPDLPNRFRSGTQNKSRCISSDNCWPEEAGEGIACKCPLETMDEKII